MQGHLFHMNNQLREKLSPNINCKTVTVTVTTTMKEPFTTIIIKTIVIIIKQKVHLYSFSSYINTVFHSPTAKMKIQTIIAKGLKMHPYSSSTLACQDT